MNVQTMQTAKWIGISTAAAMAGGWLAEAMLGMMLARPDLPEATVAMQFAALLGKSAALACGMALLARHLAGATAIRATILFLFGYVAWGVNDALEGLVFSHIGGTTLLILAPIVPCAVAAIILAWHMPGTQLTRGLRGKWQALLALRGLTAWATRLALAVLAFPVVYFACGLLIAPLVMDAYRQQGGVLVEPAVGMLLGVLLLRSALFMASSWPVIAAWTTGRREAMLRLGLAHFAMVGGSALLTPGLIGWPLRVVHGGEILADSMVYAAILVALLWPRARSPRRARDVAADPSVTLPSCHALPSA